MATPPFIDTDSPACSCRAGIDDAAFFVCLQHGTKPTWWQRALKQTHQHRILEKTR